MYHVSVVTEVGIDVRSRRHGWEGNRAWEVMDGVLLQLSMRANANLTLSTLAICLLGIACDSCCRSAEVVVRITVQSGLADTEGDGRPEQLCLRHTQWQRHITCSPRILTLLVMVTTSTSNISEVWKTMKIYRLPSCDKVYCGTTLHVARETALYQLS
jgi:hypothetical protein